MMTLSKQLSGMGFPEAARMIDRHYKGLFNYMAFPKAHWTKIRTTNLLENTNRKLKQRSQVAGAFPNNASLLRLAGTLLMDREEEWKIGCKLIDLEENPIDETGLIVEITAKY